MPPVINENSVEKSKQTTVCAGVVPSNVSELVLPKSHGIKMPKIQKALNGINLIQLPEAETGVSQSESLAKEILSNRSPLRDATKYFRIYSQDEKFSKIISLRVDDIRTEILKNLSKYDPVAVNDKIELRIESKNQTGGLTFSNYPKLDGVDNPESLKVNMKIVGFGDVDSLIKSILPHEITHVLLGQICKSEPPRWANEGLACFNESPDTRKGSRLRVGENVRKGEALSLRKLFSLYSYPEKALDLTNFYDHSTVVTEFLIRDKGMKEFVLFIKDVSQAKAKDSSKSFVSLCEEGIRNTYGYKNLEALEDSVLKWVNNQSVIRVIESKNFENTIPREYFD